MNVVNAVSKRIRTCVRVSFDDCQTPYRTQLSALCSLAAQD